MIAMLSGTIKELKPNFAIILTPSGVGYGVHLSINCSSQLNLNEQTSLRITQIIKEDSHRLFGFLDPSEQKYFEQLIKVNGVGAVSAMAILSAFTPAQLAGAIAAGDVAAIKKAPGIGPKTAQRLILELKDKFATNAFAASKAPNGVFEEAYAALLALGFKADAISKALAKSSGKTSSELIKSALKNLS